MDQLPGLLDTLDLKAIPGKAGRVNPLTGLLNEVVNPPVLNQPDPRIITGPQRQQNFQNWFQGSQSLDPFGRPLTLYHGTTHDFNKFNPLGGAKDNFYGSAIYLTSSPDDASSNYLSAGTDITRRIERKAEELMSEEDTDFDEETAYFIARNELLGPAERILPVHAALKNPVYVSDTPRSKTTNIDFKEIFGIKDGPDYEKYEDENEYQEALDEWYATEYEQMATKINDKLEKAFHESYDDYDEADYEWESFKEIVVPDILDRVLGDDGNVNAKDLDSIIRENQKWYPDYGSTGEIIKNFFKELGYDGIIMDASKYFPRMESIDDAMHHIIFDPTKVKGLFNRGTYDPDNPDYLSRVTPQTGLIG